MTRHHESTSFRTTAIVIGFSILSLFIFITLSNLLAPEKPEAPKASTLSFEAPPPLEVPDFSFNAVPARHAINGVIEEQPPPPESYRDDSFATVTGTITDIETGDPVQDATINAQWIRTEEEIEAFEVFREELLNREISDDNLPDEEIINPADELFRPNKKHSNQQTAKSRKDGSFTIYVPYDRPANFGFTAKGFLNAARTDEIFSREENNPLNITLSRGASISGRIYNIATNEAIGGMYLSIDPGPSSNNYHQHVSDVKGNYIISGLVPAEYELKVEYRNTRFKPGKVLPYQRITIHDETQKTTNIDFGLTRAGIVWGYTRAPEDNSPLNAQLLLMSSESMLTQGINAAMSEFKEEQGVYATYSKEDREGYYEIAGVPLNKEWRVYATTNERAPQLSDPFILSASNPDIRVDINLINGSTINGIVIDGNGDPIQGAEVYCLPGFAEFFAPLSSAKVFRDSKSQEDGTFALNDLPSGSYNVFAFKKGFKLTARGTPIFPNGYSDMNGIVIELHTIDHGEHIIFGIVTDPDGRPIEGAEIEMGGFSMDAIMSGDNESGQQETVTNEYGEYLFENVSLGKYVIGVESQGYAPKVVSKVYLDKPTDIVLGGNSIIQGTVYVRETNRPFDGSFTISANPQFELRVNSENPLKAFEFLSNNITETFTDTNGEFELAINAGDYTLRASAKDFLSDEIPITVEENDTVIGIRLYINTTGGSIEGRVTTADGFSPQGTRVRLTRSMEDLISGMLNNPLSDKTQTLGEDGRFLFEQVPNGKFVVVASHSSYASTQFGPIVIADSDNISNINIRLGSGGTLEGQVFNKGRPMPNVMVMLISTVSPISATTDANGNYKLEGLNAGEHRIIAVSPFAFNSDTVESQLGETVIVEEGKTTRKDLELSEITVP